MHTSRRRPARGFAPRRFQTRHAAIALALAVAGCGAAVTNEAVLKDGWDSYAAASQISCAGRPVLVEGNRQDLTIGGSCDLVRISGAHNDIAVTMATAGTIDITGTNNDVSWAMAPGANGMPHLLDHGANNTYHAPQ